MPLYKIAKKDIPVFADRLKAKYNVIGPVAKGEEFAFAAITDPDELRLDFNMTLLPAKEFLTPHEEILFSFSDSDNTTMVEPAKPTPQVLFGLHACDLAAIDMIDRVFLDAQADAYYKSRRSSTLLIGVDCTPQETCFCDAWGIRETPRGFDLFLSDIGDSYYVTVGTEAGAGLLEEFAKTELAGDEDTAKFEQLAKDRESNYEGAIDISELSALTETKYEDQLWDEFGAKCLSCGACSVVCPTCHCFDVCDSFSIDGKTGERVRKWDSCMSSQFATVTHGENFRPTAATRVRNRYYHKFYGYPEKYGEALCVGCGRCERACKVDIHPLAVIEALGYTSDEQPDDSSMENVLEDTGKTCTCGGENKYLPLSARIISKKPVTDMETIFRFKFEDDEAQKAFSFNGGQFMELSLVGVGEAPISICSSPTHASEYFELCVRKAGDVTKALHKKEPGDVVGLRGPYGTGFPYEEMRGHDILVVATGLGIAPLMSLISHIRDERDAFGHVTILMGARYVESLLFMDDLKVWNQDDNAELIVSITKPNEAWTGAKGRVTEHFTDFEIDGANTFGIICGPPAAYQSIVDKMTEKGMSPDKIFVSLERRMKCGMGKCGHCGIGHKYACVDGPVFSYEEVMSLRGAI